MREMRPAPGTDLMLRIQRKGPSNTPFKENASPSSPEIDTIEYLEPATNITSSDNAKTHANIVPFIDIEVGIIDQRIYTLKKEIPLKSSNLAPVQSSSHHCSRKNNILSSQISLLCHMDYDGKRG